MKKINWRFKGNERKYIDEVLASGFKAGADGAFTTRLEALFAKKHKVSYAVAFNSAQLRCMYYLLWDVVKAMKY